MLLPLDEEPFVVGTVFDPDPDGILASEGVVGISGESSDGEPTGELDGVAAPEVVGPLAALHWLTGGVCKLQAPGRARASVWFIAMPRVAPPPFRIEQRHCGCD